MKSIFKFIIFTIAMSLVTSECDADPMTNEEFLEAAKGSFVTEMGSFGTTTGDEKKFGEYIRKNWRAVLDDYENLAKLKSDQMHGLNYTTVALACEELPPFEYLDFLDIMLDVLEQRKARNDLSTNSSLLLSGRDRKKAFLSVNWEHPRVQAILQRAVQIFSDVKPTAAASFQSQANGELADSYMANEPDDATLPETLPGIKLQRPFASLIRKFETLTGNKGPPDPRFPDREVNRPNRRSADYDDTQKTRLVEKFGAWKWAVIAAVLGAGLFSLRRFIKHHARL